MNKRDRLFDLIQSNKPQGYIPAAFFLHFDPTCHQGQAAVAKHLEFFRFTGMDFVKIQYEQKPPPASPIRKPADWAHAPRVPGGFFEPTLFNVKGLVEAAGGDALVLLTIYSPFMWAAHVAGDEVLSSHLKEDPEAVLKGLEIMTDNVLGLVKGCKQAGIDGFYVSTQGGESFRFPSTKLFEKYIKPSDLAVWEEVKSCRFNILHICDYVGGYDNLTPFLDYPGHVVNSSLKLGSRSLTPKEISHLFQRPFMGGMERKGIIATGRAHEIRQAVEKVIENAPEQFILGADCTVPGDTPWENLKTAIETAHSQSFA